MPYGRQIIGTIGIMSGIDFIHTEYFKSLSRMIIYNERFVQLPAEEILYKYATVSLHSFSRNALVNETEGDWLLMLDCDMTFEPDLCGRMLRVMNEKDIDVLTGVYYQKFPPHLPLLYRYDEALNGFNIISSFDIDKVFKIDAAGAGCLLVKQTVFDKIRDELNEGPFTHKDALGEDLSFFSRLRELNIESWCDPRIQVQHLSMKPITEVDSHKYIDELPQVSHPVEAFQV